MLDVGANRGQYASGLRSHGYVGRIESFEPNPEAAALYLDVFAGDADAHLHECALGAEAGRKPLHLAANGGASSSLFKAAPLHDAAAPHAGYVGDTEVEIARLDSFVDPADRRRFFCKVDTQGSEYDVLLGAGERLGTVVVGLQLEISFGPLYEAAPPATRLLELVNRNGFEMIGAHPGLRDPSTGLLLQADVLFVRD